MKSKYNCPVCGKVPNISFDGATNKISCCSISISGLSSFTATIRWKSVCKLFKKEYELVNNIEGRNPRPKKDSIKPPKPPVPPKDRIVNP